MTLANIDRRRRAAVLASSALPTPPAARVAAPGATRTTGSGSDGRRLRNDVRGARCPVCGYVYDEAVGDAREGFSAGTPWRNVPDTWCCPDCGVREKVDFIVLDPTGDRDAA